MNAGNGGAGPIIDLLEPHLPFKFVKVFHEPDGTFPNGVPNPMIEENRKVTIERMRTEHADLGIAWDGDYDRCFFFDEHGDFIEGYYIVGMLAQSFSKKIARRADRARPAAHLEHARHRRRRRAARPCRASRAMRSSSRRCARSTPSTAAR